MISNRWWVYQRERFPIFKHGLLIGAVCFGALVFSLPNGETPGPSVLARFAVAFATVFLPELWIVDEIGFRGGPLPPVTPASASDCALGS
jgi:4-hydroxybenzoate polyprenyltransferase